MKVLYVSHADNLQGSGKALLNIIKGMVSYNIKPVIVLPGKGALYNKLKEYTNDIYCINCYQEVYPQYGSFFDILLFLPRLIYSQIINYYAYIKLSQIARKEKPNIIHSNTGIIRYGSKVAHKLNIPHVWHLREYQIEDFHWHPIGGLTTLKKLFNEKDNHCVAITRGIYEYFELTEKDIVNYDGVFSINDKICNSPRDKYFLFVGSITYGKGVLDAVKAFDMFSQSNKGYKLYICGEGGFDIKNEISKLESRESIICLGRRDDVYELMSMATALLVPSYSEGFGFITVEAMINRCIVIGRNTAGTKEQFDNGLNWTGMEIGYRFSTVQELCQKMINIVQESESPNVEAIRDAAFKVAFNNYNLEKSNKTLYEYYNTLLKYE